MLGKCQYIIVHPLPLLPLIAPPAGAMTCGLINSALMGAQRDGGGVGVLEVAGLACGAL